MHRRRDCLRSCGPRYRTVHRGVHVGRDEQLNLEDRCRALGLILGSDAVFSHHTAAALHGAPVPDESYMESKLRLMLVLAGLPEPDVNEVVYDIHGTWIACPDLAWRPVLLGLQYEGNHHRVDPRQWHSDINRDEAMVELGWTILRITSDDVNVHPAATVCTLG